MGKSSDEFNSNENDDENTEESSDEDEQGPNENNQSAPHADLSSLNRETTYNVRRANQDWPRLILFLTGNGTRIVESCNRNRHARNGHFLLTDIFMIMFMLFATIMFITHIPLDTENRQTHIIGMPDDVNNTYQSVPVNNENARNDNFDDDARSLFSYDEPGFQLVIMESNASEAVDNRTYDSSSFISAKILNDTNFNLKIVEEKEITFSSTVELYVDDIIGIDSNSDDTHSITSVRSPISDNDDENIVSEISLNLNDNEDDQIDDSDEESSISHTEDDSNDSVSDVTDGGYDTRSESSASEISTDTNGEDTLINNDDERSLVPNISYETNSENDSIDDDDRWSDISHITYYISSEDDSINDNDTRSTDDDYGTKSEIDSLVNDEEDAASVEIQNNESADEEVSTIELSIPPTLLTDSTTETNADLLPNLKQPAIMSSMNPNNVEQSSSFNLNEEEPSSQVFDDRARNMNPDVSADIHPPTDSNAAHHQGDRQSVGSENPHHSADRQGHALPSSVLISNTLQNNEQAASQTSLPGQSSVQIEKTSTGESESDGEEMSCSTRSMNMKLQKQTSPAVDSDEESSKQNVD